MIKLNLMKYQNKKNNLIVCAVCGMQLIIFKNNQFNNDNNRNNIVIYNIQIIQNACT